MARTGWRSLMLAFLLLSFVFSVTVIAAPSFTDQAFDSGYVNPKDQVVVQKIRITNGSSTINSVSIRNLGDADETDITRIVIDNDDDPFTTPLKEYTSLTGLRTGVTFPFGYTVPSGTSYLWIGVELKNATALKNHTGRKIQFQVRFYSGDYTSDLITDGSPETIFWGGFEKKADHSPSAGYLNPGDTNPVQKATFTDIDGNSSPVGITEISVSNTKNANQSDVASVEVKVTAGGTTYTASKAPTAADWGSGNPLDFSPTDFTSTLPASFADNSTVTVEVDVSLTAAPKDKNEIQTSVTLTTKENGQTYTQTIQASTAQTIRKQGFEATKDVSPNLTSGVLSPGKTLVQKVMVTDDDANSSSVTITGIWIKNKGDATKADIKQIVVKRASTGTVLFTLPGGSIVDFNSGHRYIGTDGFTQITVGDDESVTLTIEYTANDTITDGHTLQPEVYFLTTENGKDYNSDSATYPKSIVLHPYGLESVINIAMTDGTAYSGQRVLVQKVKCEDLDEDSDSVYINPVRIKNIASTSRCADSEVTKIEVRTKSGALLGETTDLSGLNTGGVAISTLQNNVVRDDSSVTLYIYVTFAGPENVTAGHKLKLETTIFSEEDGHAGENFATGAEWTLAINHRPVPDFTFGKASTASVGPKADFTYQDTIQFHGTATDPDGDTIVAWHWDFGDGTTSDAQNPTHQYPNGGTFDVTLTVTDDKGLTGSVTKTITVEGPPNQPPVVDFTWSPAAPAVGEQVTFTATVTDPDTPPDTPFTYAWDFGDGKTSTAASPTHAFAEKKSYTVTLTVTDARGGKTTATKTLSVGNEPPVASFTASKTTVTVGEAVQFTDTSTDSDGTVTGWAWDFGDGTTSTDQNPTHTYTAAGTYTVTLIVTDDKGTQSAAATQGITVSGPTGVITYSYPNPAATQATIVYYLPTGTTDLVLHVYDIAGNLVYEHGLAVTESTYSWDLTSTSGEALPNGLYFYVITGKDASGKAIRSPIFKLLIKR